MAEKITPRSQDFAQWYQDVVLQAKLADYSPVKGCMVMRPNGYSIWERIQAEMDLRIKETGVRNAYFPLFIPESFLKKEAEHVEGFAPQCAVVTYAGAKDLEEKLVVRPTSETIINSMFAKWIQSYRDLPMLINQWANVVRWEMRTRLFLRTSEFLWQEGHTCHATPEEAEEEARKMLKVYQKFSEDVLAVPVIAGKKSASEKFAGALQTYTIEGLMQDGKALQNGTSHNLSTNFAQAFQTRFLDKDGELKFVHQTSWGTSTRLVGAVIMVHSDDRGLVLPPALAHEKVVIIPIGATGGNKDRVLKEVERVRESLSSSRVTVRVDSDENKQPGWKFHEAELIGIPIRIEMGPRDIDAGEVIMVRRDTLEKTKVKLQDVTTRVVTELGVMQRALLDRATQFRSANTHRVTSYGDFKAMLEEKGGFFEASWCQSASCESKVKDETKATIRCLLLNPDFDEIKTSVPCLACGGGRDNREVVWARSY